MTRRGLVLGGGGVLGAAWSIGALCALEDHLKTDVRDFDHIVGTSAGSVLAAMLGAGITPRELREHQLGGPVHGLLGELEWDHETATGGHRPLRPRLGPGSPRLVAHNARRLWRLPPTAVLSAFVPEGRGSLDGIHALIEGITPDGGWSPHPGVWIVTMNYETGRRVPFGRPGEPTASLAEAVTASCAIPGWFSPVVIDGYRYVDGGACSATSVDILAGLDLDEVYVVAPMVSPAVDRPASLLGKLERQWRSRTTKRCHREADKLRTEGTRVTILGPSPDDLRAFGANVMDVTRRLHVLDTSAWTTERALRRAVRDELADAG
jgi:NTE family protein